jgi:hypothetical protein
MQAHKPSPSILAAVVVALAAMAALALFASRPTAALGDDAPPAVFSAARATRHLQIIAARPHPIGSSENAAVRAYLLEQLRALGLEPQVQSTLGLFNMRGNASVGNVHNIVARKAGSAPDHAQRRALLLVAHYDSAPQAPGAGDDGANVAAILETLRALKTGTPLANDLIVLLTDGEEAGLLGAEAFVTEHPWARDIGMVINMEGRGNAGPSMMFETSVGNGPMIEGMAASVPHPVANSLNYEVYKLLPNDTDMSVFKRKGLPGLNFAAIEGHPAYHSALDTAGNMSQATLQHHGETMLSLVRHFGQLPLQNLSGADRIYFDFPGLGLIHYPAAWALPLAIGVLLLLVVVTALGVRSGLGWRKLGLGVFFFIAANAVIAGGAQLLWMGAKWLHPAYAAMAHGNTYNSHWYLAAIVALALAAFCALAARLQHKVPGNALALGSMMVWAALLMTTAIVLPGATFLLTWPLLAMLLALGLCLHRPGMGQGSRCLVLLAGAAPGVLMFTPLVWGVFVGLTPNMTWVAALVTVQLLGLLAALLAPLARPLGGLALLLGLVLLGVGSASSGSDAARPRQANLFYLQDGQSGKALWLSTDTELNAWSRQYIPAGSMRAPQPTLFGNDAPPIWSSPAPSFEVTAPVLTVLSDQKGASMRQLELEVKSLRAAAHILVTVEGATVYRSYLNTRLLTRVPRAAWALSANAIGPDGVRLTLEVEPGKPFVIRARERSYGLPAAGKAAMPADMILQPFGSAGTTQSLQVVQVK